MTRSNLVDVTLAMSRELLSEEAYEREEREIAKAEMRLDGVDEAEIALIFGDASPMLGQAPAHQRRVMEPF